MDETDGRGDPERHGQTTEGDRRRQAPKARKWAPRGRGSQGFEPLAQLNGGSRPRRPQLTGELPEPVVHELKRGSYTQQFSLARNGVVSTIPAGPA